MLFTMLMSLLLITLRRRHADDATLDTLPLDADEADIRFVTP